MEKLALRMTPVILLVHLSITIMEEEIFIKHQSTITPKCPAIWLNAFRLNDVWMNAIWSNSVWPNESFDRMPFGQITIEILSGEVKLQVVNDVFKIFVKIFRKWFCLVWFGIWL